MKRTCEVCHTVQALDDTRWACIQPVETEPARLACPGCRERAAVIYDDPGLGVFASVEAKLTRSNLDPPLGIIALPGIIDPTPEALAAVGVHRVAEADPPPAPETPSEPAPCPWDSNPHLHRQLPGDHMECMREKP